MCVFSGNAFGSRSALKGRHNAPPTDLTGREPAFCIASTAKPTVAPSGENAGPIGGCQLSEQATTRVQRANSKVNREPEKALAPVASTTGYMETASRGGNAATSSLNHNILRPPLASNPQFRVQNQPLDFRAAADQSIGHCSSSKPVSSASPSSGLKNQPRSCGSIEPLPQGVCRANTNPSITIGTAAWQDQASPPS